MRVAYFVTCIADVVFPHIGEAGLEVLERVGIRADFPMSQTCCGQPAFNSGFQREAREVAAHFVRAFQGYEAIVTPSGSCAAMVRHYYGELLRGHPLERAAQDIAARAPQTPVVLAVNQVDRFKDKTALLPFLQQVVLGAILIVVIGQGSFRGWMLPRLLQPRIAKKEGPG